MDADPRDALIVELRRENARLTAEVSRLTECIRQLEARIAEMERQAFRSAASFRREERDKKPPELHGRPGRKPGHPPAYRVRPDQIDEQIDVPLTGCPRCGGPVTRVAACEQFIEDLPPIRPHVTRLVMYTGCCAACGEVRSTHPEQVSTATGAAATYLGSRALAPAAQVSRQFGVTKRTCAAILKALGGLRIAPGGWCRPCIAWRARPNSDTAS